MFAGMPSSDDLNRPNAHHTLGFRRSPVGTSAPSHKAPLRSRAQSAFHITKSGSQADSLTIPIPLQFHSNICRSCYGDILRTLD